MAVLNVFVSYDAAEKVWAVDQSDIPGLNVEAPSYEELVEIVLDAAPDLIDANLDGDDGLRTIPLSFQYKTTVQRARHA